MLIAFADGGTAPILSSFALWGLWFVALHRSISWQRSGGAADCMRKLLEPCHQHMHILERLKRTPKYISDIGIWLGGTRPLVWILVAVGAVWVAFVLASSCMEQHIRWSGMALQLVGVLLVGVGLIDTRRAFEDQPTTWQGIKQWWAGRPRLNPNNVALEARGMVIGASFGSARARMSAGPNASVEHRLATLEREHAELFDEIGKIHAEIKQRISDLSNALAVERSNREEVDKSIRDQLRKAIAGGLPLGRVGAICFFVGIIGGSLSPEIASWLGGGPCQA
jgi:hypothetical protein